MKLDLPKSKKPTLPTGEGKPIPRLVLVPSAELHDAVRHVCAERRISIADFLWHACNLALEEAGRPPVERPVDKRRRGT